ncbi:MAG: tRNA (guanosine(46)-N7)-methyltransferase TrmB [Oscillospiraceae bacterium]|nr:tRNA (guanosine(46)-N7)-methyltransferase TrmB [Oscillospiraceae bacterium]
MRPRKKKHGDERREACQDIIITDKTQIKSKPVIIEIGCGKGRFITELAARHPDKYFIALEKVPDIIVLAAEKIKNENIPNVNFICDDVKNLLNYFGENEVESIYLNFSDPWPKAGHHKRRLTYKSFLDIYRYILTANGKIYLKTDNRPLFDFSIEQLSENGFTMDNITYDLHNSEYNSDNIMTEYETNFSAKGFAINRLEARLFPAID